MPRCHLQVQEEEQDEMPNAFRLLNILGISLKIIQQEADDVGFATIAWNFQDFFSSFLSYL